MTQTEGLSQTSVRTRSTASLGSANRSRWRFSFGAPWAPLVLDKIFEDTPFPDQDSLARYFTTQLIAEDIARRIAKAWILYQQQDFDEAAHLLAPRIETILRGLAYRVGVPVTKEPHGAERGGVVPLGTVLRGLRGILDESWLRYLVHALADPLGLNLRNRISHGLIGIVDEGDSAILLHIACYLRLLQLEPLPDG